MVFYGLPADWGKIMQGAAATWSTSMPLWFIEPVSYFLVLGICGTYISFLAGNISNFRLPVSAVAQEVAQVEEGSHEGEIISTLAIAATQVMITVSALTGAIFVSAIVGVLPVIGRGGVRLAAALDLGRHRRAVRLAQLALCGGGGGRLHRRGRLLRAPKLEPYPDPGGPDGRHGAVHPQSRHMGAQEQ